MNFSSGLVLKEEQQPCLDEEVMENFSFHIFELIFHDKHNDNDIYSGSIELNHWKILIIIEAVK